MTGGSRSRPLALDDALELLVDARGDEAQRELTQGGQVGLGEEPVESDPGAVGRVDVAVPHALPEGMRAHVHELDLVGGLQDLVGQPLVDRRAGDGLDRVGDRLEVLDVAGADDLDAGVEDELDVLPALLSGGAGDVGVGQLVDHRDRGMPLDDSVGVHLLDDDAAVLDALAGQDLETIEEGGGQRAAVGLHEADHDVRAASLAPVRLLEHAIRLADARGHAQVDPQAPARCARLALDARQHLVTGRASIVGVVRSATHGNALTSRLPAPIEPIVPGSSRVFRR